MTDIRKQVAVPKTGLVDVVGWAMTLLGAVGLAIAGLQFPVLLLIHPSIGFWGLWFVAAIQFAVIASIGLGLRRRRALARVALICVLAFGLLWNTYWLMGAILAKSLPLLPEVMVQVSPFRFAVIGLSVFWSLVNVWLLLKFTKGDVIREFARHDA